MDKTDNEWAAGFVGLRKIWHGYVWPHSENQCIQDFWEAGTNHCDYCTWQPDSDLNDFKLVLDKYGDTTSINSVNAMALRAWFDPAKALKAIRKAIENGSQCTTRDTT